MSRPPACPPPRPERPVWRAGWRAAWQRRLLAAGLSAWALAAGSGACAAGADVSGTGPLKTSVAAQVVVDQAAAAPAHPLGSLACRALALLVGGLAGWGLVRLARTPRRPLEEEPPTRRSGPRRPPGPQKSTSTGVSKR